MIYRLGMLALTRITFLGRRRLTHVCARTCARMWVVVSECVRTSVRTHAGNPPMSLMLSQLGDWSSPPSCLRPAPHSRRDRLLLSTLTPIIRSRCSGRQPSSRLRGRAVCRWHHTSCRSCRPISWSCRRTPSLPTSTASPSR
jgi:hypothetical protein